MKLLIKNGNIVDPKNKKEFVSDILIENSVISKISENIIDVNAKILDAKGFHIMPGFIDMYEHLRDPGNIESEDIISGSISAAAGGFTTVCTMPDTVPAVDCIDVLNYVNVKAKDVACINIIQAAAITKGNEGKNLVDFNLLGKSGTRVFSNNPKYFLSADVLNKAFYKIAKFNHLFIDNCIDINFIKDGVMNESAVAKKLGLKGIENIAEDSMIARNLFIAMVNGINYHIAKCSTTDSLMLVSMYKDIMKEKLTCSVTPHHLRFCDEDISKDDSNYKTMPPLRSGNDRKALIKGLKDGIIDVIVSGHSPQLLSYKQIGFNNAPFGMIGSQTAFSVCLENIVDKGILTLAELIGKLSYNPSKILNLDNRGLIEEGNIADICISDINEKYILNYETIKSKSKNSPFINKELKGKIKYTLVGGKIVYNDMERIIE